VRVHFRGWRGIREPLIPRKTLLLEKLIDIQLTKKLSHFKEPKFCVLVAILSQMNPVHALPFRFLKVHIIIIIIIISSSSSSSSSTFNYLYGAEPFFRSR
jgi:hypothetical protein